MNSPRLAACHDCRALVPDIDGPVHPYIGASAGCWEVWGGVQARAMSSLALGAVSPLAVDAYCAQHPGARGRRQAQSVIVHLASICLVQEHACTPTDGIRAKQVMLATDPVFDWLTPPADPGALTVLDVAAAGEREVASVVGAWAASVWAAFRRQPSGDTCGAPKRWHA